MKYIIKTFSAILTLLVLSNCASQSAKMAHKIQFDENNEFFKQIV